MTKIKPIGKDFLPEDGWEEGDKVEVVSSGKSIYPEGKVFTLEWSKSEPYRFKVGDYTGKTAEFKLVEEEMWSDWEVGYSVKHHSKYYRGCDFEKFFSSETSETKCRIKLPKRVSVQDLKGTVEMKDGKPDWSTYKE